MGGVVSPCVETLHKSGTAEGSESKILRTFRVSRVGGSYQNMQNEVKRVGVKVFVHSR